MAKTVETWEMEREGRGVGGVLAIVPLHISEPYIIISFSALQEFLHSHSFMHSL